ncbi:hypothetical protein [Burkholderia pseudomallei]|uniref:hypothetical protein n=1 Tax=Burkholderia pseudomallei TaxID=28450 RepID=UPI000F04DA17|nr:hypothetical protein [Burkholderia pseudomallei]
MFNVIIGASRQDYLAAKRGGGRGGVATKASARRVSARGGCFVHRRIDGNAASRHVAVRGAAAARKAGHGICGA